MKNYSQPSTLLGLTQLNTAMLLGVGLSHYSMFEAGKRPLPARASKLLAELLSAIDDKTVSAKSETKSVLHLDQRRVVIEKELLEYTWQKESLKKKIAAAERKYEAVFRNVHIVKLVNSDKEKSAAVSKIFLPLLAPKISVESQMKMVKTLETLKFQLEAVIMMERFCLTSLKQLG